ncbi:MAG: DUF1847 domain-containing protein [Bacillota bacterium]|jgi:uncharacterized metal-binding protein
MRREEELYNAAFDKYSNPTVRRIALSAARTEAAGYCEWTRVEEVMEFSRGAGFQRLGIAFCVGLRREAAMCQALFEANGFEVRSVACKTGRRDKSEWGLKDDEKIHKGGFEAACNPVAQALLLNKAGTDLNVLIGLCVGHDTLVMRFSEAPVTVLIAKDRVLAHNPAGALYCHHSYFGKKLLSHGAGGGDGHE